MRRFRNLLRGMRDRYRHGATEKEYVVRRVRSWVAHAEHANTAAEPPELAINRLPALGVTLATATHAVL